MSNLIFCLKLKKKTNGLKYLPFYGSLGERIYFNISKKIWKLWLKHQTILINEKCLNLFKIKDRKFLYKTMEKFFFEE
ncbi:oxidative damage protection protein [Candidatus Zinderia endosymbiont of Aphrophora alni]|uniref:oxidative damage protection protein n=1 Tax=Candidatus Zinderia endosymbiont of Aphrophora alni TaxID=3077951 RepID=UPI0030D2BEC6